MKLPKSFNLSGIRWTVEETNAITDMGHCCSETATIRLRSDLTQQMKEATFCHELQHAIRYACGVSSHDEREVDAQAIFLHQFLQQFAKL